MKPTQRLSEFASSLTYGAIPTEVTERAALLVLDLWGIMVRARHDSDSAPCVLATARDLGWLGGSCSVVGDPERYTPAGAAFLNGTFAHTLDFDDTHAVGSLHPSASVVPAALAAAEITDADGPTLLAGIVAGYEVVCRVSHALVPAEHYERGYHPSATAGAFGAAAAAARVLGLDSTATANALGAALSHAAGTMQFLANGSWNKRTQLGGAAMSGLIAATLARHGYLGAAEPIEGRYGYLRAYAPNPIEARATADLGSVWETMNIGVKPYPSCRFAHAAVDVILDEVRAKRLDAADVEAIEIGLARKCMDIVATPQTMKRRPQSVVEGQFSVHFNVALALQEGGFGWDDYAKHVGNVRTEALCDRITVVNDPEIEELYPEHLSAAVTITTKSGKKRRIVQQDPRGEPSNWLSDADMRRKFTALASPYLGDGHSRLLADRILALSSQAHVRDLLEISRPATAGRTFAA